jgi:hypothetical protein
VKAWRRDGDKLICEHGTFELPISCPVCAQQQPEDDNDDVPDDPLPAPPDGCFSLEQHETWFGEVADRARDAANSIAEQDFGDEDDERGLKDYAVMAKLWETAIKARRAAAEFAAIRERRAYVMQREKRILDRDRARRTSAQP